MGAGSLGQGSTQMRRSNSVKWSYHGQELRQKDPVEHSDSGAECGLARAEGFKVAELSLATPEEVDRTLSRSPLGDVLTPRGHRVVQPAPRAERVRFRGASPQVAAGPWSRRKRWA